MSMDHFVQMQPKVTKMLLNSYRKGRLAHAYLFEGEKGTKKKELATMFAKLLYCENEKKPCNECINCLRIDHHNHPNVLLIEPDGNTLKKEQILYLQKEYAKTTLEVGPKVYIVNEIEKMSVNASNSLLKFIEEPEKDTYTILITDNLHQILPTIISRCQVLNFQPIDKKMMVKHLENCGVDEHLAHICSHLTNDLDVAIEISSDEVLVNVSDLVITIVQALLNGNEDLIIICENSQVDLYNNKKELYYFLDLLLLAIRDIQKYKMEQEDVVFKQIKPIQKNLHHNITSETIVYYIKLILDAKINIEYNANVMLLVDNLLIKMKKEV